MTNAQVQKVIRDATKRGIKVDEHDASTFLGAREMLAADPKNRIAREVVEEYTEEFTSGKQSTSFARFLLPVFETTEQLAVSEKIRADYIEIYRRLGYFGIVEGDFVSAQKFETKHGLTSAQILAMSEEELRKLAA